ncbi:MAG: hypothetical protein WA638_00070, partial [Candidatus Acidiferrales bacterium]
GYSGRDNLLRVVECKSYLDSGGVALRAFDGKDERFAKRFKLFSDGSLRKVVLERLRQQLSDTGACAANTRIRLGLVCGRIASDADRAGLRKHFADNDWDLWDELWLRQRLQRMSERGYENQVSAVVSKLLLRGKVE